VSDIEKSINKKCYNYSCKSIVVIILLKNEHFIEAKQFTNTMQLTKSALPDQKTNNNAVRY